MKPCPACGEMLIPGNCSTRTNGPSGEPPYYYHPRFEKRACVLGGHTYGVKYLELNLWDERPTPFYYTVEDGRPVINDRGEGKPATVDFLNAVFNFYNQGATK